MAETLRSYLIKIGFDIDSSSQAKFESVMVKTTAMAIGLEHAIEGLAKKAVSSFTDMTASYEKLYFLSQKLGQSAASIKSFQFAAEQNGASAAEATALVEKLIDYRRRYGAGSGNDVIGSWFKIDPNSTTKIKDITQSLAMIACVIIANMPDPRGLIPILSPALRLAKALEQQTGCLTGLTLTKAARLMAIFNCITLAWQMNLEGR